MIPSKLFLSNKEITAFFALFLLLFFCHLGFEFYKFKSFIKNPNQSLEAIVLLNYTKTNAKGQKYRVLKLKSNDFIIYTTTKKMYLKFKKNEKIKIKTRVNKITFKDYLSRSFYLPSFYLQKIYSPQTLNQKLYEKITNQHKNEKMKELYGALFLASSIGKELREDIMHWGVSHLVAISGFHLGIIFGFLYWPISKIYSFFQYRFFPFRNLQIDVSLIIFFIIFLYLWLIGFVPSFLRSYVMSMIGFIFLIKHIKILSFTNLALSVSLILVIFPSLVFSLGFWFSVMGVFYIFLYFYHFKNTFKAWQHVILLNLWTFLAMVIPVLNWFSLISWQQWAVIPISGIFIVFYPILAFFHLIGMGGIIDIYLSNMLTLRLESTNVEISNLLFIIYILGSLSGIFFKRIAICFVAIGIIPFFFI